MRYLFHPAANVVVRLLLGGILLYASWHKIADPPDFAHIIYNYRVFPASLVNLIAIYAPWVEAFVGLALLVGIGRRGASLLAAILMLTFVGLLGYNLARGCPTICGCFDTFAAGQSLSDEEKFYRMKKELLLDFGFFLLAAHVFVASLCSCKKAEGACGKADDKKTASS